MKINLFIPACMLTCMIASAQKDDAACAAKSYNLFNSFEGFYIKDCDTAEFKTLEFYVESGAKSVKKQGKYTKIHYEQAPTSTRTVVGQQIVSNYVNAVKKAKGEVVKASDDQAYRVSK